MGKNSLIKSTTKNKKSTNQKASAKNEIDKSEIRPPEDIAADNEILITKNEMPNAGDDPAINDSQQKMLKTSVSIVALLILIIIAASISNFNTYFLESKNSGVEVWKGKFSPMGQSLLMILPGAALSDSIKTTGPKKVIFPFIFDYFLKKADSSLGENKLPDFEKIHSDIAKAMSFATTEKQKHNAEMRINSIKFTVLLYKAEVGINEHTEAGLKKALGFLEEAKKLSLDDLQKELVNKKIQGIVSDLSGSAQKPETP